MIPKRAHFIWFGPTLPWVHRFALRSAALRGGLDEVLLHHADPLDAGTVRELEATPGVRLVPLDAAARAEEAGGPALADIARSLRSPAARANVARAAILWTEGGVYLDADIVTVASLGGLCAGEAAFVGEEHIVFPASVRRSRDPRVQARAYLQTAIRDVCRRAPRGYRSFRAVQRYYPRAVNNAVLASRPGHPWIRSLLDGMVALPEERRLVRFALGTHLLQDVTATFLAREGSDAPVSEDRVRVLAPEIFFPLGPEVSAHWFRERTTVDDADLAEVLRPGTLGVHWYASVRTKRYVEIIDEAYVRAERDRQLFARLADTILEGRQVPGLAQSDR